MRWHFDPFTPTRISGWIYDEANSDSELTILAIHDATVLGKATATEARQDLSGTPHNINSGFTIPLPGDIDPTALTLLCCDYAHFSDSFIIYSPDKAQIGQRIAPYQRFEDLSRRTSASESQAKLRTLALPRLSNLSVLDIGCNEGFFCQIAAKMGARRVLGMDCSQLSIEKAKMRLEATPSLSKAPIEFRHASWWAVPKEQFDVILFLSAIHYEPEQKKLLDFLATRLKPDGLLILECGVAQNASSAWTLVNRGADMYRFPSHEHLCTTLLSRYAVTTRNKSVMQKGDPVPRFVFHCSLKRPTVGVIGGRSGHGKSFFAGLLREKGLATSSSDSFLVHCKETPQERLPQTPMYAMFRDEIDLSGLNHLAAKLERLGAVEEFCRDFVASLPLERDLLFIEGEVFRHEHIYAALCAELKRAGAVIWRIERS